MQSGDMRRGIAVIPILLSVVTGDVVRPPI